MGEPLSERLAAPDPDTYLAVGQVVAPRGLRGELKVQLAGNSRERFLRLQQVYLGEGKTPFVVSQARVHRGRGLLQLEGVDDRDAAEALRSTWVYVHIDDTLPLKEDEYFAHEILGLRVVTVQGEDLGRVREILPTGANDVYVVRGTHGEILLPAIAEVIVEVDVENGTMQVRLLEGLR